IGMTATSTGTTPAGLGKNKLGENQVDLQKLLEAETQSMVDALKRQADATQSTYEAMSKIKDDATRVAIALHGTEAESFEARLTQETGAALESATERIKDNQKLADAITAIWQMAADKREAFERDPWNAESERMAKALDEATAITSSETDRVETSYNARFNFLD